MFDPTLIASAVEETALRAVKNLESAKMNCVDVPIPKVKVIGEKQHESLCLLIDNRLRRTKRMNALIFVRSGVLLMLVLLLL